MYNLYKVSPKRGFENPNIYIDSPAEVYQTHRGWICEDCVTGEEYEYKTKEDAERRAAFLESWYENGGEY